MYTSLPTSPTSSKTETDSLVDDPSDDQLIYVPPKTSPWTRELRITIFICVVCTLLNGALSFLPPRLAITSNQAFPMSTKDIHTLRRPSHFIGFDKIARPSPPLHLEFNNYPISISQIDSADANRVFPVDTHKYTPAAGTITPPGRRVLVNATISTVVQFRAIDWGMERCELRLSLPMLASENLVRPGHTVMLSIYRLNTTEQLDSSALSYTTRPQRVTKVANVPLHYGEPVTWHRSFACAMEQLLTFEVACSVDEDTDSGCYIEWWQDLKKPDPAVYMIQHSTA